MSDKIVHKWSDEDGHQLRACEDGGILVYRNGIFIDDKYKNSDTIELARLAIRVKVLEAVAEAATNELPRQHLAPSPELQDALIKAEYVYIEKGTCTITVEGKGGKDDN